MRTHRRLNLLRFACKSILILTAILQVVFATSIKADVEKWTERSTHLGESLTWIQENAWIVIPLLIVIQGIIGGIYVWIEKNRTLYLIHHVLNLFQKQVFSSDDHQVLHHHRVTLFQHKKWCWNLKKWFCWWQNRPWSGWLIPVERSGHTTRRTDTVFLAPDDANLAEGVAGKTWAAMKIIKVSDLPDLNVPEPLQKNIKEYAKRTNISVVWLNETIGKKTLPRSFCGIPVESQGNPWGVIVLDSKNIQIEQSQETYTMIGGILGKLLERT